MNKLDDPWLGLDATANDAQPTSGTELICDVIQPVTPLDTQFGVMEKQSVPDALQDPFFGSGTGALYVLLDGSTLLGCRELLEASGAAHRCLYQGEAYASLADEAPWVAELTPDNTLTRGLFSRGPAPWHMWDQGPFLILRGRGGEGGLDAIWRHLRRFNRTQDDTGKWFYLRYWEPSVIETYFVQLAQNKARRQAWFASDGASEIFVTQPKQDATLSMRLSVPETHRYTAIQNPLSPQDWQLFAGSRELAFYIAVGTGLAERNAKTVPLGRANAPDAQDWTALARTVARHAKRLGITTQRGLAKMTVLCGALGLAFWDDLRFDAEMRQIITTKFASEAERLSTAKALYDKTDVQFRALDAVLDLMDLGHPLSAAGTLRHIAPKTLGEFDSATLNTFAAKILRFDAEITERSIDVQRIGTALGAALGVAWLDNPFYSDLKAALLSQEDPLDHVRIYLKRLASETA